MSPTRSNITDKFILKDVTLRKAFTTRSGHVKGWHHNIPLTWNWGNYGKLLSFQGTGCTLPTSHYNHSLFSTSMIVGRRVTWQTSSFIFLPGLPLGASVCFMTCVVHDLLGKAGQGLPLRPRTAQGLPLPSMKSGLLRSGWDLSAFHRLQHLRLSVGHWMLRIVEGLLVVFLVSSH